MIFELSRNAPCPCDSGRKHKMCCIGKLSQSQSAYYGLVNKERLIKNKLMRWAFQQFGPETLDEYVCDFNKKRLVDLQDEDISGFFEWFFLESADKQTGEKMLKLVLEESPELFDQSEKSVIGEWMNNTQAGIFEVEDTDKEQWTLKIREVFTGKCNEITDRKASENVVKGDIFFGRIQAVFSKHYLAGVAVSYPRFFVADQLKEFVMQNYVLKKQEDQNITYEHFMNSNNRLLNEFSPEQPHIVTEEGEKVKVCERVYTLDESCVKEVADFFKNDESFIVTAEKKGKSLHADIIKRKANKKSWQGEKGEGKGRELVTFTDFIDRDGNKIRVEGSADVEGNEIKLFATSEGEFGSLVKKVEGGLGRLLKLKSEAIKDVDSMLEADDEEDGEVKEDSVPMRTKEDILRLYYKDWCGQKIPALGNKTSSKDERRQGSPEKTLAGF